VTAARNRTARSAGPGGSLGTTSTHAPRSAGESAPHRTGHGMGYSLLPG
jgi:hypothetical protein